MTLMDTYRHKAMTDIYGVEYSTRRSTKGYKYATLRQGGLLTPIAGNIVVGRNITLSSDELPHEYAHVMQQHLYGFGLFQLNGAYEQWIVTPQTGQMRLPPTKGFCIIKW